MECGFTGLSKEFLITLVIHWENSIKLNKTYLKNYNKTYVDEDKLNKKPYDTVLNLEAFFNMFFYTSMLNNKTMIIIRLFD